MTSLLWLRRDLRTADHPALLAARDAADGELAVCFVVDPLLWDGGGPVRRAWLAASVRAVADRLDGRLVLRRGSPREVVPRLARELGATSVHVTRETTPTGARRDARVRTALETDDVEWVETGTPYAVGPGLVHNRSGDPYRVFTPFARAWREHGWPDPAPTPRRLDLVDAPSDDAAERALDDALSVEDLPRLPAAGQAAALQRWREFLEETLGDYHAGRDRPDLDGTSRLSPYLKVGAVHPRTLLADLAGRSGRGAQTYATELAWREFYADVLHHQPHSAWHDLREALGSLRYDEPEDAIEAWKQGHTGYPVVDAGMRQLLAVGWMHNRLRMITASFLTKDLHVWWPVGARHFLDHLLDGDLASNNHGWQWVAGTGTDASPYFRVFNPVTQGQRFDPDGDYVRRWVPELAHLPGRAVHEPWEHPEGYAHGYPERIVDHAEERKEALRRYEAVR
ncbi:cryptochrome/photolyase family protein [Ornithinimicrobium pekingense]|uniref:Deoxyribodipyrimidine photo-lyase n=1 Tax=Ornithinimicrobium pekingense TaxID=384677 RepID=A0ABQ2F2P4_9MICO|nr:deoxyribodipyrimidine photo-lyase [Ornithinimicrobium pekingense]GGK56273.1 deoxyribodipyrimidine photo-lyase [Ornithinimicrobium pekingense]